MWHLRTIEENGGRLSEDSPSFNASTIDEVEQPPNGRAMEVEGGMAIPEPSLHDEHYV